MCRPTKARSQSGFRSGTQSDPCISSVFNCDHDYYFELPREEERDALSITRCSAAHHGDFRAVPRAGRTFQLLAIPSLKPRDAELQKFIVVLLCRVRIPILWLNRL